MKISLKESPLSSLDDNHLKSRFTKFLYENHCNKIPVQKGEDRQWIVKDKYTVELTSKGFTCSCPDFRFRGRICKHICAVLLQEDLPDTALAILISMPELTRVLKIQK